MTFHLARDSSSSRATKIFYILKEKKKEELDSDGSAIQRVVSGRRTDRVIRMHWSSHRVQRRPAIIDFLDLEHVTARTTVFFEFALLVSNSTKKENNKKIKRNRLSHLEHCRDSIVSSLFIYFHETIIYRDIDFGIQIDKKNEKNRLRRGDPDLL